jgi:CHAT domain-containing protein
MDSALLLADGGRFELGDVLALPRVPDTVVLLGCRTGQAKALPVAGLGLAQAFLLKGSSRVIASTRPLDDALAAGLSSRLYGAPGQDVVNSLRRAQLAMRSDHPAADWAGLRILVP